MGLCGPAAWRGARLAVAPIRRADGSATRPRWTEFPRRCRAGSASGGGHGGRAVGFDPGSGRRCPQRRAGRQHRTVATVQRRLWLCLTGWRLRLRRKLWVWRWTRGRLWMWRRLWRSLHDRVWLRLLLRRWLRHLLQPQCRQLLLTSIGGHPAGPRRPGTRALSCLERRHGPGPRETAGRFSKSQPGPTVTAHLSGMPSSCIARSVPPQSCPTMAFAAAVTGYPN